MPSGARPVEPELEKALEGVPVDEIDAFIEDWDAKKAAESNGVRHPDEADAKGVEKAPEGDKKAVPDDTRPKLKLKVGEEERELDHAEVERGYNEGIALRAKAEEALELHDASMKTLRGVIENPGGTLMEAFTAYYQGDGEKAWNSLVAFCDSVSKRAFELAQMPEAERNLLLTQDRLKQTESRLQQYERQQQMAAKTQAQKEREAKWVSDISAGLKKASLPADQMHLSKVADVILHARQTGGDLTVDKAVEKVKIELQNDRKLLLKSAKFDDLKDNEELLEEIRKRDLEAVKREKSKTGAPGQANQETPPAGTKRRVMGLDYQ